MSSIIGEAASRLSATVRDTHPEVPWARIVGLRNILVHVYDDVRLDLVWDAIRQLPDLEATVRSILEELPEP